MTAQMRKGNVTAKVVDVDVDVDVLIGRRGNAGCRIGLQGRAAG